jgi:hypothetical protein
MNEREIIVDGQSVCHACAGPSYYRVPVRIPSMASSVGLVHE